MTARQVVVLREGPPKRNPAVADLVVAVVGLVILVYGIMLVDILPEKDVPPTTFRIEYPSQQQEFAPLTGGGYVAANSAPMDPQLERSIIDFTVQVLHDNAYQFRAFLFLPADDLQSSFPDQLRAELKDPFGNRYGDLMNVKHEEPTFINDYQGGDVRYLSLDVPASQTFRENAKPATETFAVNRSDATVGEVLSVIAPQKTLLTKGNWTLSVQVFTAGDCPDRPSPSNPDPVILRRHLYCAQEVQQQQGQPTQDLVDRFTAYTVSKVSYDYYTIEVKDPRDSTGAQ